MEINTETQSTETANVLENEEKKAGNKTFSQLDMDNLAGKIRNEERAKSQIAIKEEVTKALEEYERQSKLSQEEKEKEQKAKIDAELKERERKITLRERKIEAQESLIEKNIPKELVDFVVDIDPIKTKENIDKLVKTFNKSVENSVTEKLKGTPPQDFSNDGNSNNSANIMTAF